MPKRLILLLVACNAPFLAGCFGSSDDGGTTAPECQLDSKNEKTPGYPFDIAKFGSDINPLLAAKCSAAGCHGAPTGQSGFTVWANAKPGDCDFSKTFNSFAAKVDLTTPANSPVVSAVNGGNKAHPFSFQAAATELTTLQAFLDNAKATYDRDGGSVVAPPGPSPYNATVFQTTIQPMFEVCATSGCHGTGVGGFTLKAAVTAGTPDFDANFKAVTALGNLETPANSVILRQATTVHGGGQSKVIDSTQAAALLAWIEDAKKNGGTNPGAGACAPLDKFNLGTFGSQIVPILSGELDLNQVDGRGRGAGCMSSQCHGTDRGPGALSLLPTADDATKLQNFACFVNLAAPSSSEILACPTNTGGCRKQPHPGQDILDGANDLNYQAILAFIYGVKGDVSPLDFAFFVRKINPIFDDVNSVEAGSRGITCADTSACHGISVAGQTPPNRSDFPIIANAVGLDRLTFNFVSATGFANFLNPGQSSLFLYPTNEIADRVNNPFATGLDHPGGLDFAPDSELALSIIQWAAGLRPDGQGFQRNWLVQGDFPATQIADQTIIDETTVSPSIFEKGFGSFNIGEWDGLFSNQASVDLNSVFPRAATGGRVGYAVSYAINTVPRQISAQLVVVTNNPIRIYVDGFLVAQNDQSGGATAILNLPAAGTQGAKPSRILLKVLQRANDAQFAFTAQLRDQQGQLLTDVTRELVFTLGLNGGI